MKEKCRFGCPAGPYPMGVYNGLVVSKRNRQAPTSDVDLTPRQFRRFVSTGVQDMQLHNPIATTTRRRLTHVGSHFLFAAAPQIPGQRRGDAAGFHRRGIDPQSYAALIQATAGSQPVNPGGPGKIAGTYVGRGTG